MTIADALLLHPRPQQTSVIFAASQLQGTRETQEDYFVNFNDECFVVADGVGGMPHGEVAAQLAGDTAVWAYRLVRQRHAYWKDRKLFLKRIFRTTNITLWQKQREEGFTDGMATTMLVCIVLDRRFYIGNVGDSSAFLVRDGTMTKLTTEDVDSSGRLTKTIGTTRYGLTPSIITGDFLAGDCIILMTDGVAREMDADKCVRFLKDVEQNAPQLSDVAVNMLAFAKNQGATDNMTVCLIKRVA
ncbi:serine/threonine-protein phosphatase [Candidatus Gottesmanbacteria bacterium]|nr:serine/threonine-protein phosphatase [Candidatus Gottesmanbacteria bacterium]